MVATKILPCLLLSLLVMAPPLCAAVSVSVERDPVGLEESLRITFEADGTQAQDPDFAPLEKDFEILSTARSSNIQVQNGHYSATTRWTVEVMARRAGALTIPALRFGPERSPARTITVRTDQTAHQSATGADILLEVEASPRNPYVQQEVLYTVRLYRSVTTYNATLTDPVVAGAQAVIKRLGEDAHFETRRGERHYRVVERRYAVFPQASGDLTIEPVVFEGRVGRGSRFGFDPFGGTRTLRRLSQAVTLDVRPIPSGFHGKTWLPARQLELQETWSETPAVFRVGEPMTRTVALIAAGLTSGQLPELAIPLPAGLKRYPDQPQLRDNADSGGVVGIRQEKIALIPSHPGELLLPAIELPWWNTDKDRQELARLPERRIQVLPGAGAAPSDPSPGAAPQRSHRSAARPPVEQAPASRAPELPWRAISLGLALGWLGTLLAWWQRARRRAPPRGRAPAQEGIRAAVRAVERACREGQPAQAKQALLRWGAQVWPDSPPDGLEALGARCGARMQAEAARLSRVLYGDSEGAAWDGRSLAEAFRGCQPPSGPKRTASARDIQPLHRIPQP